jgi:hypothetical protein
MCAHERATCLCGLYGTCVQQGMFFVHFHARTMDTMILRKVKFKRESINKSFFYIFKETDILYTQRKFFSKMPIQYMKKYFDLAGAQKAREFQ